MFILEVGRSAPPSAGGDLITAGGNIIYILRLLILVENLERKSLCSREINENEINLFRYAVTNQYWYQVYVDELPPLYGEYLSVLI